MRVARRRLPDSAQRLLLGAATLLLLAQAGPARASDVWLHFPAGGCQSGWLEVQLYDRATSQWIRHPHHPVVAAGSCEKEAPGRLLNEIRVRCIDPGGRRGPSSWVVGADLRPRATPDACRDRVR